MAKSTQSRSTRDGILRRMLMLGLSAAMAGSIMAPAMAQDRGRDRDRHDHRVERAHWDRHPRYYEPPVVVPPGPGGYYAPPPVVPTQPSGLNIVLPIHIR